MLKAVQKSLRGHGGQLMTSSLGTFWSLEALKFKVPLLVWSKPTTTSSHAMLLMEHALYVVGQSVILGEVSNILQ